jgi:DNA adenine methylase
MRSVSEDLKPRSFLRWAGSKRRLLPELSGFWRPAYRRYVEPFAGSSCLFFELQPQAAILSDKNAELMEVYEVLRDRPRRLHELLTLLPRNESTYYSLRRQPPGQLSRIHRAVRFMYLNRFCFNGLYRTNRLGQFNVPYAPTGTGEVPSLEQLLVCAELLRNATLRAWDFGTTLRYVVKGDFVYIDPPFAVSTRRVFVEYGPKLFTRDDLGRLARHLVSIHNRGATFLLSYADCREAREIFRGWAVRRIRVKRNIGGFADVRRNAYELLVTNSSQR